MWSRQIEVRHRVATFVGAVLWCTALAVTLPDAGRSVPWLAVYGVLIAGMIGSERMHVRPIRRWEQQLAAAMRRERRTARRRSVPFAARQAVLIDHRPFGRRRRAHGSGITKI